jgi:hypothetical protein
VEASAASGAAASVVLVGHGQLTPSYGRPGGGVRPELFSLHSPEGRETEARLRISEPCITRALVSAPACALAPATPPGSGCAWRR